MKKLGVYIKEPVNANDTIIEQNTFVWYEVFRCLDDMHGNHVYDVSFWSINGGYPNGRKPDVKFKTTNKHLIDITIVPMKELANGYCIEWENCNWQIKDCTVLCDYRYGLELISTLKVDQFGSNNYSHWEWEGEGAMSVLKDAKVSKFLKKPKITFADLYPSSLTIPDTVGDMIKEELKKSLEKSALNSFYGVGGFTTTNDFVSNRILSVNEALEIWGNKNKETKTMEKKTMTETDAFLKHINGITITSTYSKLDFGRFGDPYYIYYPEMEITEDISDTLLTVLLMAKREYIHKVVFNPEKGTTTIYENKVEPITVRCRDGEFDYILGYEMAKSKMYLGSDDYNWFNKIKNHRKTRIEYTEKKTKKGGKK